MQPANGVDHLNKAIETAKTMDPKDPKLKRLSIKLEKQRQSITDAYDKDAQALDASISKLQTQVNDRKKQIAQLRAGMVATSSANSSSSGSARNTESTTWTGAKILSREP